VGKFCENFTYKLLQNIKLLYSRTGGLILSTVVQYFDGFVVFQPIINGVGGNLVSVQASKISTILHQGFRYGELPSYTKIFEKPWVALFGSSKSMHPQLHLSV
jgi:cation transporter-like permease